MKISNETKVGALTAIAIAILILGFNFLKGRNLAERHDLIYSVFPDVNGLQVSNAVFIKGLQVGKISTLREKDDNLTGIVVGITLNKNINIPRNSLAIINSDLLGTTSLEIVMGSDAARVRNGDTLQSTTKLGIITQVTNSLNPALTKINQTLGSLDGLIQQLHATLDPKTQGNLQTIIATLTHTTAALDKMIQAQSEVLGKTLNNVQTITGTIASNSGTIDSTLDNLQRTTAALSDAHLDETLRTLGKTINNLETALDPANSKKGTVGLLLNDRQLYDELRMTNRSLTTLLDDLRVNPKRYVSISVFGKKTKSGPILEPIIYDSTKKK